jgi:alpha-D-ribose 1-methylphosphonate 5-triphosphate synthase subunit PhnG
MLSSYESNLPLNQNRCLSVLSRAEPAVVKAFAEGLIPSLEPIEVLENHTGLVMLPMQEPVKGEYFYLGEVLVAEARLKAVGVDAYGACLGRDILHALALAIIDAAWQSGISAHQVEEFVVAQENILARQDEDLLRAVEATRVDMETFEWLMSK